ncbi:MAG TPA: hypothetical protein VFA94_09590 [Acidimicrobiales bacterium]|nr:hypothetical protein [Acidimicrobiales bacterium]
MKRQLVLIENKALGTAHEWRLDERTKEVGRRGLAAARAALAHSEPHRPTAA